MATSRSAVLAFSNVGSDANAMAKRSSIKASPAPKIAAFRRLGGGYKDFPEERLKNYLSAANNPRIFIGWDISGAWAALVFALFRIVATPQRGSE